MRNTIKLFTALICLFFSAQTFAQTQRVTGTVSNVDGEPLIGVSITLKGNKEIGTITDFDGKYSLDVTSSQTLVFTYLGYTNQEVAIAGQQVVNVTLRESSELLDEIVVVGYGTQKKSSLTGAISNVKSDDLVRTTTPTVSGALVGKTPGISARQADGRPGASTTIQIRNMGSPLYVIDGMPSEEGQFNNIDVNDIESISVLKDASAAIYGLRAANGVILVTTKSGGRNKKSSINATGYYGFQNIARYPKPADAYQYVRASMESDLNLYGYTNKTNEDLEKWRNGTNKSTNWYDFIVRENAPIMYGNVNASGGSDKVNYYFSLSHIDQEAMIHEFNFKRTNIQTNIEANITDRLKVGTRINGRIEARHNVGVPGLDDYWQPYWAIFQNRPTEEPYANGNTDYVNHIHNDATGAAIFDKDITGYTDDIWKVISTNFYAEYDLPVKGLTARAAFSYWFAQNNNEQFEYTYDTYTYNDATGNYDVTGGNQNPWRRKVNEQKEEKTFQAQLNYANTFGLHNISGVLGMEAFEGETSFLQYNTLPTNNYISLTAVDDMTDMVNTYNERARAGFIFRTTYDYDSRYFAEFSGRYDGSYLFKSGSRWGFFPAVSAGWRISEEPFMKNIRAGWLDNLKIRASWGQMGDDQYDGSDIVAPFSYMDGYNYGNASSVDSEKAGYSVLNGSTVQGVMPRGLPITTLSWIKSTLINVGVDYSVLDQRLNGTFEYFHRKRTGLPANRSTVLLPAEVGFLLPKENLDSDAHMGVEGSIVWRDKIDQVAYSLGTNVTLARRKMLDVDNSHFGGSWDYYRNSTQDRWTGVNWGYECIGQFQSVDEIKNYPVDIDGSGNSTMLPGDLIIKDVNNDGVINDYDLRPVGYAAGELPYLNFSLNGSIDWKGFDLKFDFAGANMQTYQRDWEIKIPFQAGGSAPHYLFDDAWHHVDPTDASSAWVSGTYPAVREGGSHVNWSRNSTFWQKNVTYLKLRTLELGYTLPRNMTQKAGVNMLRFFVNGYNLFSIDNLSDYEIDPEITSTSALVTPNLRTVNFGFNLNF